MSVAAAVVWYGVASANSEMPSLWKANLEALTRSESSGNEADCFSVYGKCHLWGCVMIYKCGECVQVRADNNENLRNPGKCYF